MVSNLTNFTNNWDFMDQLKVAVVDLTGGFFPILILIGIFGITFISLKEFTTNRALAASMTITLISTVLLRMIAWVNDSITGVVVVLWAASVIIVYFSPD